MNFKKYKLGFTLIELLIALSIVSAMFTIIMSISFEYRQTSRDGDRAATLRSLEQALILFDADNDGLPLAPYNSFGSLPRKGDGTLDCAIIDQANNNLYDTLMPKYLQKRPEPDRHADKGYCYVYVSSQVMVAGQAYDTDGKKLLAAEITSLADTAMFFIPFEGLTTMGGNRGVAGVSVGSHYPMKLNYNITTGEKNDLDDLSIQQITSINLGNSFCQQNASWSTSQGKCVCDPAYTQEGPYCYLTVICAADEDNIGNQCYKKCPTNSYRDPINFNQCNCNTGYYNIVNGVGVCNEQSIVTCQIGYYLNQYGYCIDDPEVENCENGIVENGICTTMCLSGYNYVNGVCVPDCGSGTLNTSTNSCCPEGTTPDGPNGCVVQCTGGKELVGGSCECPAGTEWVSQTNYCEVICIGGSSRNNAGACTCPEGQAFNESGICTCQNGFETNGGGGCYCPNYRFLNENATPQTCDPFAVCDPGAYRELNSQTNSCVCIPGRVEENGACVEPCQNGRIRNIEGNCECPPNTTENNGVCEENENGQGENNQ